MEAVLSGANVVGIAELIKDQRATSSKLAVSRTNIATTAKTKFSQKQNLRTESSQKISAIVDEKIAFLHVSDSLFYVSKLPRYQIANNSLQIRLFIS
jgi:hypothetical protein